MLRASLVIRGCTLVDHLCAHAATDPRGPGPIRPACAKLWLLKRSAVINRNTRRKNSARGDGLDMRNAAEVAPRSVTRILRLASPSCQHVGAWPTYWQATPCPVDDRRATNFLPALCLSPSPRDQLFGTPSAPTQTAKQPSAALDSVSPSRISFWRCRCIQRSRQNNRLDFAWMFRCTIYSPNRELPSQAFSP